MRHAHRVQVFGIDSSAAMLCRLVVEWCTSVWIFIIFPPDVANAHHTHVLKYRIDKGCVLVCGIYDGFKPLASKTECVCCTDGWSSFAGREAPDPCFLGKFSSLRCQCILLACIALRMCDIMRICAAESVITAAGRRRAPDIVLHHHHPNLTRARKFHA